MNTPERHRDPQVRDRAVAELVDPQRAHAALPPDHRIVRKTKFLAASIPNTR